MKKLTFTLLTVLFMSIGANAQQVLQEDVDVNAIVIAKLAIVNSADIDLGTIVTGTASTLPANANDPAPVTNAGVGATPGQIIISGATGERISVTFTSATLTNSGGATANFVPSIYEGGTPLRTGNEVTFTSGSGNSSQITLDIGGTLAPIADGNEGDYSTTNSGGSPITFSFTYTSI